MEKIEKLREYDSIPGHRDKEDAAEMKRCAEKIWNAISKYVTIDRDAIFKDPDWPHLWDKR